ncbi:Tetratricopeptide repeat-domain-containing protein [Xylariales sp. AK1849]|nr:Tetratricopeptide repeat-domain-containing protein [Xylariales sp. AK1849]
MPIPVTARLRETPDQAAEFYDDLLASPEHPDTLTSMNNLAGVLSRQGKYEEAEQMHRQTLELRKELLGPEHPDTLASINNLAIIVGRRDEQAGPKHQHKQTLADSSTQNLSRTEELRARQHQLRAAITGNKMINKFSRWMKK